MLILTWALGVILSGPTARIDGQEQAGLEKPGLIIPRGHHTAGGGGEAPGREHSCITGQWKSTGVCTPYPASYLGTQELLGLEEEESTPEERYLVSGARIRLYVFSPEVDLKAFDEMSFQDQLQHARQQESLRTATQSKTQVGVRDPFQDHSFDPWKGEAPGHKGCPEAKEDHQGEQVKHPAQGFRIPGVQEDHQEEQVKPSAQEFRINTPPRGKLDYPEGLSPSRRAMDDRESFMTVCEERLMSLYKDLKRDYDRVHGTEKVGDLEEGTQEGLESAQDEVRSTGTGNRSTISNWEMEGNHWSRRGKEDSSPAGHAAQP